MVNRRPLRLRRGDLSSPERMMRQSVVAFAVLAAGLLPLSAQAQALPDRYGPTDPMAVGGRDMRGAQPTLLSWTRKGRRPARTAIGLGRVAWP